MVAKKSHLSTLGAFLTLALSFVSPQLASAEELERDSEGGMGVTFVYGGECSQLAQLNHRSVMAVVHSIHSENYRRFCRSSGVYSCEDYTPLLAGLGSLEDNGVDCRFVPAQP